MHAQGIAHRDLKPENLLIRADGRLIITDFGVSEVYTDASDTTAKKVGSPAFMAPEVFAAQSTSRRRDQGVGGLGVGAGVGWGVVGGVGAGTGRGRNERMEDSFRSLGPFRTLVPRPTLTRP